MKLGMWTIVLAGVLSLPSPAAQRTRTVVTCDGGEELQVEVKQKADGAYRADVTIQSVGDSYPTFHYKVERKQAATEGAPLNYEGKNFSLSVKVDTAPTAHGILSQIKVTDLDIDQRIYCEIH